MRTTIKTSLFKLLNLFPGEERQVMLFTALGLLWSFGTYAAVTLADGFFLQKIGSETLPEAYFLIALSLFAVTSFFLFAFNHYDVLKIYQIVLASVVIALSLLASYIHFFEPPSAFWFLLKVFCNTFTVALTTCFWFFLDQYFNTQNAKRLYTLFSSGIFLGNGLGSLFIAGAITSLKVFGVLTVLAGTFALTWFVIGYVAKKSTRVFDDLVESSSRPEKQPLSHTAKGLLRSRFTLLLIGTYLLIQLLYVITEMSYMKGFEKYFENSSDSNALIIFLSKCTAFISFANIIFGLFFYSRMVSRIGVNTATLISPLFFLGVFTGYGLFSGIIVSVFSLAVAEGVSYVIDENNSNLLLNTVPFQLKNKVRVALDSFFEPLGMLISSLALLIAPVSASTFGLILTLICLLSSFLIRREYRQAVCKNLSEMGLAFHRHLSTWLRLSSEKEGRKIKQDLLLVLRRPDESAKLFAFELLLHFDDPKILPKLLFQTTLLSVKGRLKVLHLLEKSRYCKHQEVTRRLLLWMREFPGTLLEKTIQLYLARIGVLHPRQIEHPFSDLISRKTAILSLKTSWANLSAEEIVFFRQKAQEDLERLLLAEEPAAVATGIEILGHEKSPSNLARILPYLRHNEAEVALQAARSVEQIIDAHDSCHALYIIETLTHSPHKGMRFLCLQALAKVGGSSLVDPLITKSLHFRPAEKRLIEDIILQIGPPALAHLWQLLKDEKCHDRSRILTGRILAKLAPQELVLSLKSLLPQEVKRAHFYFFQAHKAAHEELRELLIAEYLSAVDLVVQLVALSHALDESALLSRSLFSTNPKTRGTALETLEKTADKKLWGWLKPLLDERPLADKIRFASRFVDTPLALDELIAHLERSACHTTQLSVMILKAKLALPGWQQSIEDQREGKGPLYYQFATELIMGEQCAPKA